MMWRRLLLVVALCLVCSCVHADDSVACDDVMDLYVYWVPHTHTDAGWIYPFEQYYTEKVHSILNNVVNYLTDHPDTVFNWADMGFFVRWWREQPASMRARMHALVTSRRLVFVGGGWVMNDEARVHYDQMVRQTRLGLAFIEREFGAEYMPRFAWQIDPFGGSIGAAMYFADAGYEGLVRMRINEHQKLRLTGEADSPAAHLQSINPQLSLLSTPLSGEKARKKRLRTSARRANSPLAVGNALYSITDTRNPLPWANDSYVSGQGAGAGLQFLWRFARPSSDFSSDQSGLDSDELFTHVLAHGYDMIDDVKFEKEPSTPMMTPIYTQIWEQFASHYHTPHLLMPFGRDFAFDAYYEPMFEGLRKVIRWNYEQMWKADAHYQCQTANKADDRSPSVPDGKNVPSSEYFEGRFGDKRYKVRFHMKMATLDQYFDELFAGTFSMPGYEGLEATNSSHTQVTSDKPSDSDKPSVSDKPSDKPSDSDKPVDKMSASTMAGGTDVSLSRYEFPVFNNDDFFPYADQYYQDASMRWWSGYYTSRSRLSKNIREISRLARVARLLLLMHTGGDGRQGVDKVWRELARDGHDGPTIPTIGVISPVGTVFSDGDVGQMVPAGRLLDVRVVEELEAILQHHDAITGTSTNHTTTDYYHMSRRALRASRRIIASTLAQYITATASPVRNSTWGNVGLDGPQVCFQAAQGSESDDYTHNLHAAGGATGHTNVFDQDLYTVRGDASECTGGVVSEMPPSIPKDGTTPPPFTAWMFNPLAWTRETVHRIPIQVPAGLETPLRTDFGVWIRGNARLLGENPTCQVTMARPPEPATPRWAIPGDLEDANDATELWLDVQVRLPGLGSDSVQVGFRQNNENGEISDDLFDSPAARLRTKSPVNITDATHSVTVQCEYVAWEMVGDIVTDLRLENEVYSITFCNESYLPSIIRADYFSDTSDELDTTEIHTGDSRFFTFRAGSVGSSAGPGAYVFLPPRCPEPGCNGTEIPTPGNALALTRWVAIGPLYQAVWSSYSEDIAMLTGLRSCVMNISEEMSSLQREMGMICASSLAIDSYYFVSVPEGNDVTIRWQTDLDTAIPAWNSAGPSGPSGPSNPSGSSGSSGPSGTSQPMSVLSAPNTPTKTQTHFATRSMLTDSQNTGIMQLRAYLPGWNEPDIAGQVYPVTQMCSLVERGTGHANPFTSGKARFMHVLVAKPLGARVTAGTAGPGSSGLELFLHREHKGTRDGLGMDEGLQDPANIIVPTRMVFGMGSVGDPAGLALASVQQRLLEHPIHTAYYFSATPSAESSDAAWKPADMPDLIPRHGGLDQRLQDLPMQTHLQDVKYVCSDQAATGVHIPVRSTDKPAEPHPAYDTLTNWATLGNEINSVRVLDAYVDGNNISASAPTLHRDWVEMRFSRLQKYPIVPMFRGDVVKDMTVSRRVENVLSAPDAFDLLEQTALQPGQLPVGTTKSVPTALTASAGPTLAQLLGVAGSPGDAVVSGVCAGERSMNGRFTRVTGGYVPATNVLWNHAFQSSLASVSALQSHDDERVWQTRTVLHSGGVDSNIHRLCAEAGDVQNLTILPTFIDRQGWYNSPLSPTSQFHPSMLHPSRKYGVLDALGVAGSRAHAISVNCGALLAHGQSSLSTQPTTPSDHARASYSPLRRQNDELSGSVWNTRLSVQNTQTYAVVVPVQLQLLTCQCGDVVSGLTYGACEVPAWPQAANGDSGSGVDPNDDDNDSPSQNKDEANSSLTPLQWLGMAFAVLAVVFIYRKCRSRVASRDGQTRRNRGWMGLQNETGEISDDSEGFGQEPSVSGAGDNQELSREQLMELGLAVSDGPSSLQAGSSSTSRSKKSKKKRKKKRKAGQSDTMQDRSVLELGAGSDSEDSFGEESILGGTLASHGAEAKRASGGVRSGRAPSMTEDSADEWGDPLPAVSVSSKPKALLSPQAGLLSEPSEKPVSGRNGYKGGDNVVLRLPPPPESVSDIFGQDEATGVARTFRIGRDLSVGSEASSMRTTHHDVSSGGGGPTSHDDTLGFEHSVSSSGGLSRVARLSVRSQMVGEDIDQAGAPNMLRRYSEGDVGHDDSSL